MRSPPTRTRPLTETSICSIKWPIPSSAFTGVLGPSKRLSDADKAQEWRELLWQGSPKHQWQNHWLWPWLHTRNSPIPLWTQVEYHLTTVLPSAPLLRYPGQATSVHTTSNRPAGLGRDCCPWSSSVTSFQACTTMVQQWSWHPVTQWEYTWDPREPTPNQPTVTGWPNTIIFLKDEYLHVINPENLLI